MAPSAVTSSNARTLAAQGYSNMDDAGGQSTLGVNLLVSGVSVSGSRPGLLTAPLALLSKHASLPNLVAGTTVGCSNGGTLTYDGPETLLNISASNCVEGTTVINGSMTIALSNVTGDPGASASWSADMDIDYKNISVIDSGVGIRITGDMTLNYNQTSPSQISASIAGDSLHMRYLENGTLVYNTLMTDYSLSNLQNVNAYSTLANFKHASTGSSLGSISYQVTTSQMFQRTGTAYPHSGVLKVLATNNSSVTLRALSNTNVRLELDTNGDGTIDETVNTTWATLAAEI